MSREPSQKKFKLADSDIVDLATGRGACFATDKITVKGDKVGFMYREAPDNDVDSGWRFLAGNESESYMDDPDNIAIYDVNTIANHDRSIIPFLDAVTGSAFRRNWLGRWVMADPPDAEGRA